MIDLTMPTPSKSERDFIGVTASILLFCAGMDSLVNNIDLLPFVMLGLGFVTWFSMQETSEDVTARQAEEAYYNDGEPIMSDDDYDDLKRENPSEAVGAPVIGGTTHATLMRSLQNARDEDELRDFFNKITATIGAAGFIIEPKIDGLALNVTYSGGGLVSAVTRGDGVAGQDVTEKVRHLMPETLGRDDFEIRGELYLTKSNLAAINRGRKAIGDKPFKTCQSATTATLMFESVLVCQARQLKFVAYDMGTHKQIGATNQAYLVLRLKALGFDVLEHTKARTFNSVLEASKQAFADCKLPCDGAVIKLNVFKEQDAIGVTKQAPKYAIAWKGDKK